MLASIYPEDTIRSVLEKLEALDVLEYIDYHPESMVLDRGKIRCFCPIHGETVFRTLVVDEAKRSFRCAREDCPGTEGGDIVALAAWSLRMDYDTVLRRLVEEFSIPVELPKDQEALNDALVEAGQLVDLMQTDPANRATHAKDARDRIRRVLEESPGSLPALRVLRRLLEIDDPSGEMEQVVDQLSDAELAVGSFDAFERTLLHYLASDDMNLPLRKKLADQLVEREESDRAVEQYMVLADAAEMAGDYETAIAAYRAMERVGDTGIDTGPVISQLLILLDNNKEASREQLQRAKQHFARNETDVAESLLLEALELDPLNAEASLAILGFQIDRGIEREEFMSAMGRVDGHMEKSQWSHAIEILNALAGAMPDDTNLIERLFACHRAQGNAEMVRKMQGRLVELYLKEGDSPAARVILDEVLTLDPENRVSLRQYAELAAVDNDSEAAITHYRTLAQVCDRQGDIEGCLDAYRRMQEVAPDSTRVALELVDVLRRVDRPKEAVEALLRSVTALKKDENLFGLRELLLVAMELDHENPEFLLEYARVLEALGDVDKAIDYWLQGCRAMIAGGQASSAEEELKRLLEQHPRFVPAREVLAEALAARGKKEEAIRELEDLARHLRETRRLGRCREVLEQIATLDSFNVEAHVRLVDVHRAVEDQPRLIASLQKLMRIHKAKRRYGEAIAAGEEAVALEPNDPATRRELLELYKLNGDLGQWGDASRELAEWYRESGDADAEQELIVEILHQRPRAFDLRERLMNLLGEREDRNEALMEEVDHYIDLCEREGELERAADYFQEFRLRVSGSAVFSRRLIELFQKASRNEEQEDAILELVRNHEDSGKEKELVPLYRQLIELKPSEVSHRRRLASLLAGLQRGEEAAEAAVELAELHARHHRYDEAEEVFKEVFELSPENERAWRGMAAIANERGHAEEAVSCLQEFAQTRVAGENFEQAYDVLQNALEISPHNPGVQREVVNLFLHSSNRNEERAVEELEKLGEYHAANGDPDSAFSARREAIELKSDDIGLRRQLVNHLMEAGRRGEAIDELLGICEVHREHDSLENAISVVDECLGLSSNHLRARSMRAQLLEESGSTEEALDAWRELAPLLERADATGGNDAPTGATGTVLSVPLMIVPEYSFDQFIVGDHNRFAHATAMAVARSPGRTPHNPLFVHSDVGLGKTHLLHAVANHTVVTEKTIHVIYTNAEDFTSDLVEAIRLNAVNAFRSRYKSVDVLLIDDVHFLAGKEVAQEEFFHIFNTLYQARRQIIVTSDRPPRDISHLEKRLKSRFGAGVIVDIQPPGPETRLAILRRDAALRPDLTVPDDVLQVLAERIDTNVRELKASLSQLLLQHEIGGEPLARETAEQIAEKLTVGV